MGNACRRKEDEVAYAPLLSNQVMTETGLPLFNNTVPVYKNGAMTTKGHNNLAAAGAAVTVATLTAAATAIKTQMDIGGQDFLNILPKYILTSVQQEIAADQLMRSTSDPVLPNAGANNPFQGSFMVIGSPRITGTQWFLASDPTSTTRSRSASSRATPARCSRRRTGSTATSGDSRSATSSPPVRWTSAVSTRTPASKPRPPRGAAPARPPQRRPGPRRCRRHAAHRPTPPSPPRCNVLNFVRNGHLLDYNNTSGVTIPSSNVVVLTPGATGGIGIAEDDIPDQTVGAVRVAGVNALPANPTDVGTQMTPMFWDAANTRLTTTSAGNTPAGLLAAVKANGDTTAEVILNGMPGGGT